MSPEQARGKVVDKRADIWAFGCVLFEMLTGRRPFDGETSSDTISAILTREPDWTALPAATPARLRALLQRCLEKDPKRRLRDIGEARIEIEHLIGERRRPARPRPRAGAWRRLAVVMAVARAASCRCLRGVSASGDRARSDRCSSRRSRTLPTLPRRPASRRTGGW